MAVFPRRCAMLIPRSPSHAHAQVISLISGLSGATKMSGQGVCPSDSFLEGLANDAFKGVPVRTPIRVSA